MFYFTAILFCSTLLIVLKFYDDYELSLNYVH